MLQLSVGDWKGREAGIQKKASPWGTRKERHLRPHSHLSGPFFLTFAP